MWNEVETYSISTIEKVARATKKAEWKFALESAVWA